MCVSLNVSYWSNLSGVTSRNGCRLAQAALFTSRSMGPMSLREASVAPQSARSTHTGVMEGHCERKHTGGDNTQRWRQRREGMKTELQLVWIKGFQSAVYTDVWLRR